MTARLPVVDLNLQIGPIERPELSAVQIRYLVRFVGHVQGVGFRVTAIQQARGLSVHGFVRNEPDGSVLMDVDGTPADLRELVRRIKHVMRLKLDDTIVAEHPAAGRDGGFRIRS